MSLLSCRHTLTDDVPQTLFLFCCSFVFCRCTQGVFPILFPCLRPILTLKYQKWFRTSKQLNILTFSNVDSNIRQLTLNITLLTNAARRFSDLETSQNPVIADSSPSCDCSLYRNSGEFRCKYCSQNEYNTWVCPVMIDSACFTNDQK